MLVLEWQVAHYYAQKKNSCLCLSTKVAAPRQTGDRGAWLFEQAATPLFEKAPFFTAAPGLSGLYRSLIEAASQFHRGCIEASAQLQHSLSQLYSGLYRAVVEAVIEAVIGAV
jgi:hypothetical protein